MCNSLLLELIEDFKGGNTAAFEKINDEFNELILCYAARLGGEDYAQDLRVFLLELILKLKPTNFKADESDGLKRYILVSLKHRYIAASKEKQAKEAVVLTESFERDFLVGCDSHKQLILKEMLESLSEKQRLVIIYKYICGYSDAELGSLMNISRQAINRLKNRSISKLREYYISDGDELKM